VTIEARKIRLIMELRRSGITDTRVLAAIERIPRDAFIPEAFADQAYENRALPIGHGQTISQPYVVALMSQALALEPGMKVLELGTGSGYQAAVLSRLCRRVYTVERIRSLLRDAEATLTKLRIYNVTTRYGDGAAGWPELAPFERMIVTAAAAEDVPDNLVDQLSPDGVVIIPLGREKADQTLYRIQRTASGLHRTPLCPVRFVPLIRETESAHNSASGWSGREGS